MNPLKVLVVDDSAVARRLLTDTIAADPGLKVIGTAADGTAALKSLKELAPDIITLDVEMPGLSGIDTVREVRKQNPHIPIIMFSSLTEIGSTATLEALTAGASDYVTKPTGTANVMESKERIKKDLITKIKALCSKPNALKKPTIKPVRLAKFTKPKATEFSIVAIGCSTGGPTALAEIIPHIPANFSLPVVITQHMPPVFTKSLATRLSQLSKIKVVEAEEGMPLEAGKVYIAPGDFHLELKKVDGKVVLHTHKGAQENSCRPAVDVMFRSIPSVYGGKVLGVILTGMGQDGMLGAKLLAEHGGSILVQDEETSVVWGMPGAVVTEGLADEILPLKQIAAEIVAKVSTGRSALKGGR